ncbi:MAG: tRNA pseudouridine(38-40) synthase TruA [Terriglobia bacterium]
MRNVRLCIAYDGTDFAGWQRQPSRLTIQGCIENALGQVLGHTPVLNGSGRTDSGVHAVGQIANFHTDNPIPCPNLIRALNGTLPSAIRVLDAREAVAGFHERYDARVKVYRYRILQTSICPPFLGRFVYHCTRKLDYSRMDRAAKLIEGRRDFTSFAAAADRGGGTNGQGAALRPHQDASSIRTVFSSRIVWKPRTSVLLYEVHGNGFLHHMVRNIAGTLIEIGAAERDPGDILGLIEARDRRAAGPTAPARGLCLVRVEY